MRLGEMEWLGPAAAVAALAVLVVLPDRDEPRPASSSVLTGAWQAALEQEQNGQNRLVWHDDEAQVAGVVTPANVFMRNDGTWCRNYSLTVSAQSGERVTQHVACRTEAGWRNVEPAAQVAASPE